MNFINYLNHYATLAQIIMATLAIIASVCIPIFLFSKQHRINTSTKEKDNLMSADPLKIETAVFELKSKKYKKFNSEIKLAFIKRLKKCPLDKYCESEMRTRLTYVQWILLWLHENCQNQDIDLGECDFTNQDFVTDKMKFADLFSRTEVKYSNLRFRNARICKKWLDGPDGNFRFDIEKEKMNKQHVFECECSEGECTKTLPAIPPLHQHALMPNEIHF